MAVAKILVVDDDELVRLTVGLGLQQNGFDVTATASITQALEHIRTQNFDVLLSKLAMPESGEGLSLVSEMRDANPGALTLLLSGSSGKEGAAQVIRMQSDEIFVKPADLVSLVEVIRNRVASGPFDPVVVESVATILDRETQTAIQEWFGRAQLDPELMSIPINKEMRCAYLTQLFRDLVIRLRSHKPLSSNALNSVSAAQHGANRREQGYTAAMMVTESRMLQVTIFHTLQKHLESIDCSVLLLGVMAIADECDSQLAQAMTSYITEGLPEPAKSLRGPFSASSLD